MEALHRDPGSGSRMQASQPNYRQWCAAPGSCYLSVRGPEHHRVSRQRPTGSFTAAALGTTKARYEARMTELIGSSATVVAPDDTHVENTTPEERLRLALLPQESLVSKTPKE